MKDILIMIEGGSFEQPKKTRLLRNAIRKLLEQKVPTSEVNLTIDPRAGERKVVKDFKIAPNNPLLLVDMDGAETELKNRLKYFDIEQEHTENRVFFMIQKMEAWILSQPDVLEKYVKKEYLTYKRRREGKAIEDDNILKNKHPKDIEEPDKKLHTLLGRYFVEKDKKKVKYESKLTTGAALLELLDIQKLSNTFTDVKKLLEAIEMSIQNENKTN